MATPQTMEYLEADIERVNKEREAYKTTMPAKDAGILTKLEKLDTYLKENNVPFRMQVILEKEKYPNFDFIWQFHNFHSEKFNDYFSEGAKQNAYQIIGSLFKSNISFFS